MFGDRITKGVHVMVGSNKRLEKRYRVLVRATRARVSLKERLGDDRTILDNTAAQTNLLGKTITKDWILSRRLT